MKQIEPLYAEKKKKEHSILKSSALICTIFLMHKVLQIPRSAGKKAQARRCKCLVVRLLLSDLKEDAKGCRASTAAPEGAGSLQR